MSLFGGRSSSNFNKRSNKITSTFSKMVTELNQLDKELHDYSIELDNQIKQKQEELQLVEAQRASNIRVQGKISEIIG